MFFNKYKKRVREEFKKQHEHNIQIFLNKEKDYLDKISILNDKIDKLKHGSMADLMRESLGITVDFSAASKDKCMPVYYLDGLSEEERKHFITEMETIYTSDKFHIVLNYMINLFATNAIYKEDKEQMKNGQIAVAAFRTLINRFDDMHREFLSYKKTDEEFDPLGILPE